MSRLLARYLLMSDAHWMVVPPEEQKGIIVKGWDRLWNWLIFRRQKRKNNRNFRLALINLSEEEHGRFDKLIFTGDLVECVFNERGIITPTDIDEIATLKKFMLFSLQIDPENAYFVPGDHELGYDLPLKADPEGGMWLASLENFQNILSPLWSAWRIGDFHFVTISSSLFIQKFDHLEDEEQKEIKSLRKEQEKFLIEYLLNISEDQKVFLFLHDADAIEIIDQLPGAEKITKVICGHFHRERNWHGYAKLGELANSFWGRLMIHIFWGVQNRPERARCIIAWAKGNPRRLELFEKYNLTYVPSIAETKSFLVLELYDDGGYEIQKFTA